MGHAPGQAAHRFHLLGLQELGFEPPLFHLRLLAFGEIAADVGQRHRLTGLGIPDHEGVHLDGNRRAGFEVPVGQLAAPAPALEQGRQDLRLIAVVILFQEELAGGGAENGVDALEADELPARRIEVEQVALEVGDADQVAGGLDDRGELLLFLFVFHELEGEGDVGGQFVQELDLRILEEALFRRVEVQGADHLAEDLQGQAGRGPVAVGQGPVPPGRQELVLGNIVTDAGGGREDGRDRRLPSFRRVVEGESQIVDIAGRVAELRGHAYLPVFLVQQPHPGQPEAAILNRDPADLLQQRLPVPDADDGGVHVAEQGVDPVQMDDLFFGQFPLADITGRGAQVFLVGKLHVVDGHLDREDPAVFGAVAGLDGG